RPLRGGGLLLCSELGVGVHIICYGAGGEVPGQAVAARVGDNEAYALHADVAALLPALSRDDEGFEGAEAALLAVLEQDAQRHAPARADRAERQAQLHEPALRVERELAHIVAYLLLAGSGA